MKTSSNSIKLNPYKIVWAIILNENNTFKFEHFPNKEMLLENIKGTLNSKAYIITDKQFGMIQNCYNEKTVLQVPKPFTHSILLEKDGMKSLVPLSETQFNNPIQF